MIGHIVDISTSIWQNKNKIETVKRLYDKYKHIYLCGILFHVGSSKNNLETVNASEPTNQQCQQPAANGNKQDLDAILTEANSNGDNRKRQRSHSLPERSTTTSATTRRASEQLLTTQTVAG